MSLSIKALIKIFIFAIIVVGFSLYFQNTKSITSHHQILFVNPSTDKPSSVVPFKGVEYKTTSQGQTAWWTFNITHEKERNSNFNFVADDCIEEIIVNGKNLSLHNFSRQSLCDLKNGITLDLKNKLKQGENVVTLQVSDFGGDFKIKYTDVGIYNIDYTSLALSLLVIVFFVLWPSALPIPHELGIGLKILFGIFLLLVFQSLFTSAVSDYSHDFSAHLTYITYFLKNLSRPNPFSCFECYQPPIYYFLSSFFYKIGAWVGFREPESMIQLFSIIIYCLLINVSLRIILKIELSKWPMRIGSALIILWPLGITKATDINNDMLVSMLILWSLYHTIDWYQNISFSSAIKAIAIAALAMFVKSNAIIAFVIFAVATLLLILEKRLSTKKLFSPLLILPILFLCCLGSINTLYLISHNQLANTDKSTFVFHALDSNNPLWLGEQKPSYYLSFPWSVYLDQPYMNTFSDETGRKFFWNSLLKTSLFGEWNFGSNAIANYLNIVLISMIIYTFTTLSILSYIHNNIYQSNNLAHKNTERLILLFIALSIIMLASFRVKQPFGCNQDIRYIYSTIPLFCTIYAFSVHKNMLLQNKKLSFLGIILAIAIIILGTLNNVYEYTN